VYEAWGTGEAGPSHSGRRAAVKVIDLRLQSKWAQGKLRSEADNLKRAQGSQHIVGFYDEIRHGPFQLFVLEACGQCDLLDHVLEHRGLGESRAGAVVVQLLKGLAWLHDMNICHGDVKPENLLCERRDGVDFVKLADFGSAMLLPRDGTANVDPVAQGTTLYSPPEVILGKTYSCAADMWATGITTYVLISGNFPFGSTSDALSACASFDGAAWSSHLAVAFISALLRRDPNERPSASEAQAHAWISRRDHQAKLSLLQGMRAAAASSLPVQPQLSSASSEHSSEAELSTPQPAHFAVTVTTGAGLSGAPSSGQQTPSKRCGSGLATENASDADFSWRAPAKKRFRASWEPAQALNLFNSR